MAIYHLSVKPVTRAAGRCATASAAYRAADKIHDRHADLVFDYTRKRGVPHSEIVLSTEAARADINWPRDRTALWNAAEAAERRKDARVAREYEVALPHELRPKERIALVRSFARDLANRYGCAVDFAIHAPHRQGDQRNHHAPILTTTREVTPTGLGPKTSVELSDGDRRRRGLESGAKEIELIRECWASLSNEARHAAHHDARIDHRSLEAQSIEHAPTHHKGPDITALERRGEASLVVERWREEERAEALARLQRAAELGRLEREASAVKASMVDLSHDLQPALRERDAAEKRLAIAQRPSSAEIQREAREEWLRFRERRNALAPDVARERSHQQELEDEQRKRLEHGHDLIDDDLAM